MARSFALTFTLLSLANALKILQIVPGFTNSHVLFNYRLAETLTSLGHTVKLWTQMEMAMLDTGNNKLPKGVEEFRIPIQFKDKLKLDGLKVFQSMIFNSGDAYELWWTGQEFKSMRVEACEQMLTLPDCVYSVWREEGFDLAIAHFHDLCPLAIADKMGVNNVVWITHGTSIYDFTAEALGLRTTPACLPHPLSSAGFELSFFDRLFNLLWHLSTIDFVNLPQDLLYEENFMYTELMGSSTPDLWSLSRKVPSLFINGERMLDFPRPLPISISFTGELGWKKNNRDETGLFATLSRFVSASQPASIFPEPLNSILENTKRGLIVFSLGTVSNTTNMPKIMIDSFVGAFARIDPGYTILWRMEMEIEEAKGISHLHLLKWLPQRDLMRHPKMKLLIAHGGYNSLLETAQAGIPAVMMPLFADQKINAQRATRFGIARILNKHTLSVEGVHETINDVLTDEKYAKSARRLSLMLSDRPTASNGGGANALFNYLLSLSTKDSRYFTLFPARHLSFIHFYSLPQFLFIPLVLLTILSV
uniref:UDP-glucuronosyltransferase n=1 Tax=Pristionchus pacificus TaxID=54126 RepID=A0A8R1YQP0_PRIPA